MPVDEVGAMAVRYAHDLGPERNPARTWFIIQGFLLLATALLGLFQPVYDALHNLRMHIEHGEDALHWVLGITALVIGFAVHNARVAGGLSVAFGAVYLATGVLGFFVSDIGPWHVGLGDNLLHLALGLVSLAVGFAAQRETTGRTRVRATA